MQRNVLKTAEQAHGVLSNRREMTIQEFKQLLDIFNTANDVNSGLWDAITTAYNFGVALGYRQAQADIKRR